MKPKRIQRKRTKGWKNPPNTIYVGRPTKYGNPFKVGDNGNGLILTAEEAVEEYKEHYLPFLNQELLKVKLGGKNLSCFCRLDMPCHTEVLLRLANDC